VIRKWKIATFVLLALICLLLASACILVVVGRKHLADLQQENASLRQQLAERDAERLPSPNLQESPASPMNRAPDWQGNALYVAAHDGDLARLKEMLDANPVLINKPVGTARATLLHTAAHNERLLVVEELLRRNADVNATNAQGGTPLHDCIQRGNAQIASILVTRGADLTIKNQAGQTPLAYAITLNRSEIVELLRQHGAQK
jgi:hypothetical protein